MILSTEGPREPHRLSKGANVGLEDLDSQLDGVIVVLETGDADGFPVDADVSVLLHLRNLVFGLTKLVR